VATPKSLRLRREAWGFIIGSALFIVGAVPAYLTAVGASLDNLTFFVGSLFFTLAAFIQLNLSGRRPPRSTTNRPDRYDWWSAAIQFAGTLFFNLSTATALSASLGGTERTGWRPDAYGSVCFLLSSLLAVVATTGRDALWDPKARTWRSAWLNLLGSVAFGVAAVGAFPAAESGQQFSASWATVGTIAGGVCFLVAAALTRPGTPRLT
jgi:drug/metabolite transporter (DMT)-like permease